VAAALDPLAELYCRQGKYPQAKSLYRQALAIHEKAFGADSASVLPALNAAGVFFQEQGKYADAEPPSTGARSLSSGSNDPEVAKGLNARQALSQGEQVQ